MSISAMMGKRKYTPLFSRTSLTQAMCEWMLSTLRPSRAAFRASNSSWRLAKPISSVVQTGVKSAGCEKNTTHLPGAKSANLMGPVVVSASKSGACAPMPGGQ